MRYYQEGAVVDEMVAPASVPGSPSAQAYQNKLRQEGREAQYKDYMGDREPRDITDLIKQRNIRLEQKDIGDTEYARALAAHEKAPGLRFDRSKEYAAGEKQQQASSEMGDIQYEIFGGKKRRQGF